MKKVFTVGVFDFFHLGHLRLFQRAKKYGDYLIIAIQDQGSILKYKPNANLLYSNEERVEIISSIKIIDEVIIYKDVDEIVKEVDFDVFIIGEDQTHEGFQKAERWCNENNKRVIRLSRTPGICSSDLKSK